MDSRTCDHSGGSGGGVSPPMAGGRVGGGVGPEGPGLDGLGLEEPLPSSLPDDAATAAEIPPTTTASPARMRTVLPASSLQAMGFSQERLPPVAMGDFHLEGAVNATKSPHVENSSPTSAYLAVSEERLWATSSGPCAPPGAVLPMQPATRSRIGSVQVVLIGSIAKLSFGS